MHDKSDAQRQSIAEVPEIVFLQLGSAVTFYFLPRSTKVQ